ncbi:PREDICTED: uncharacterized protein LOC108760716 [Trachymyrmex cornetzi]|uniref:uncharacterized protein LOC108760716 n=1 Tax=Trachymyrmex cornetzi TaxID=471704 RepID=UPI00084F536A|nr:PREDICTED: uncharacterized protein LOC108760716 [Trachymyrmex cornetzi]
MKRSLTFFILALIATVIADDNDKILEGMAKEFEIEVSKLRECLDEEGLLDLNTTMQKFDWNGTKEGNEDAKAELKPFCGFMACTMEKQSLMEGGKLATDKMIENIKERGNKRSEPQPPEEMLTNWKKCMNSLNENSQLTREERACGLLQCFH